MIAAMLIPSKLTWPWTVVTHATELDTANTLEGVLIAMLRGALLGCRFLRYDPLTGALVGVRASASATSSSP
jgi:hypothetical protein